MGGGGGGDNMLVIQLCMNHCSLMSYWVRSGTLNARTASVNLALNLPICYVLLLFYN